MAGVILGAPERGAVLLHLTRLVVLEEPQNAVVPELDPEYLAQLTGHGSRESRVRCAGRARVREQARRVLDGGAGQVDLDKNGVSLGSSISLFGFKFDGAVAMVFMKGVRVKDSAVSMVGVLDEPFGSPELLTTIGNGNYQARYLIFSGAMSQAFDL